MYEDKPFTDTFDNQLKCLTKSLFNKRASWEFVIVFLAKFIEIYSKDLMGRNLSAKWLFTHRQDSYVYTSIVFDFNFVEYQGLQCNHKTMTAI